MQPLFVCRSTWGVAAIASKQPVMSRIDKNTCITARRSTSLDRQVTTSLRCMLLLLLLPSPCRCVVFVQVNRTCPAVPALLGRMRQPGWEITVSSRRGLRINWKWTSQRISDRLHGVVAFFVRCLEGDFLVAAVTGRPRSYCNHVSKY